MRHKIWTAAIIVLGLLSITPIIVVTRTWLIVHPDVRPTATPGEFVLEAQAEGFTCGMHALSMVYKAYGLDPEAERLRWRLGVDTKAVAWMSDSTGALHPDMWMVLSQDHFRLVLLEATDNTPWDKLKNFLDSGHPAVLLIKRRENGNLHWVVATRTVGDRIEIYDSLAPEPYTESSDFMDGHIVSALLVWPTPMVLQSMSSIDAHLAGMGALRLANKRINAIEADEK